MRSTGNTILIAGATSGIGLDLAERLSEAGNQVIVAGRRLDALRRISDESPRSKPSPSTSRTRRLSRPPPPR
jgi:uncharacterized oxidoreductase